MDIISRLLLYELKPPSGYLFYSQKANSDENKYLLPSSLFSLIGPSIFYQTDGTPIAVSMVDILAWTGINLNHIIATTRKGLAIYAASSSKSLIDQALRWAKEYPSELDFTGDEKIYYDSRFGEVALRGTATFSGIPTITSDGVTPGNGPSFSDVITWTDGATLYVKFKVLIASADVVGDVQVFGPVYLRAGYLVAKDGTNEAVVASTWANGDVVTAIIQMHEYDVMRIGRV